ncbi:hypothetical protein HLB23_36220 [Nocardia uniformis]|uniref:Uncharacterized protein n=1 Tax=Nocardia uniformis TaxID=53432 RepID=A0A849CBZ0_9NOCA|nr:hypothetical protein [Nocardia uniformis]NNH75238.1 hypothetical protein [Nocardia uniformis]
MVNSEGGNAISALQLTAITREFIDERISWDSSLLEQIWDTSTPYWQGAFDEQTA